MPKSKPIAYFLAVACLWVTAATAWGQPLQVRMAALIDTADLGDADVSFYVMDLADGLAVAEMNGRQPMIPASNMKLVTSAAAVTLLGEDFEFTTRLYHYNDTLYVLGSGDPAFGDSALLTPMGMNVEQLLERWVKAAERAGIGSVDTLVIDDRAFDRDWVHPSWPTNQLHKWYCAPVAGMNFNNNCIDVYATPTRVGDAPRVHTMPLDAPVELSTFAVTGSRNSVWADREPGTNNIDVQGVVKHKLVQPIYVTVHNPAMVFGNTLRDRLVSAGIDVDTVKLADEERLPTDAVLVAEVRTPIREVLARCNKDSQNMFAESLLKRIGREATGDPGSWESGIAAERMFLSKLIGPESMAFVIDDGSGMSRENRVTTALLCQLMRRMDQLDRVGPAFRESLSVGGVDGTLRERFRAQRLSSTVQGKSGYIKHTLSLSGYMTHDGHTYAFSMILNDYKRQVYQGKALFDRLVGEIDKELVQVAAEATATVKASE